MKKLALYITALLTITSCEVVLDVEVPEQDPKIVLNSVLNPDSIIVVDLSEDTPILTDREFTQIGGAVIQLFENGNAVGSFEEVETGIYRSNTSPIEGRTYRIEASKSGYDDVQAEFVMPQNSINFSSQDIRLTNRNGYQQAVWEIEIDDPSNEENYYEITVQTSEDYYLIDWIYNEATDTYDPDTLGMETATYTDYIELDYSEFDEDPAAWGQTVLLDDKAFNGQKTTIKIYVDFWQSEAITKTLTLRNCDETYYNYIRSNKVQDWNDGDPFAEPVIVTSNIENGYGIFSGFSSSSISEEFDLN